MKAIFILFSFALSPSGERREARQRRKERGM
jgi:hypothetical protein